MEVTSDGFKVIYERYTSIHYPCTFIFNRRGTTEDADVISIKVDHDDVIEVTIKEDSTSIDLRLLLQKLMMKGYKNINNQVPFKYYYDPFSYSLIDIDVYSMVHERGRRKKVKKKIGQVGFELSLVDSTVEHSKIELYKRLAPKGAGKPYFVGYPQIDVYTSDIENQGFDFVGGINVIRTAWSVTQFDQTFYPRGEITREIDECGVFLKWRTSYGAWGYWLFSGSYEEEIRTKSRGVWDFHKGGEITRKHLGLSGEKSWKLSSHVPVMRDEIEEVKDLYTSNEVYLFRGEKKERYHENEFFKNWERVEVVGGNVKFNDPSETYDVSVTIAFKGMITRAMVY